MKRLVLLATLAMAACAPLGPPPPLTVAAASGPTNAPFYNAAAGAAVQNLGLMLGFDVAPRLEVAA